MPAQMRSIRVRRSRRVAAELDDALAGLPCAWWVLLRARSSGARAVVKCECCCACRAREHSNGGSNGGSGGTSTRTGCRVIRASGRALRTFALQVRLALAHPLRWRGLRAAGAARCQRRLGAATRSPEHEGWLLNRGRLQPPSAAVERAPSLEGDHARGGASIAAAGRRAGLRLYLIPEKALRKPIWLLSHAAFLLLRLALVLVLSSRPPSLHLQRTCAIGPGASRHRLVPAGWRLQQL